MDGHLCLADDLLLSLRPGPASRSCPLPSVSPDAGLPLNLELALRDFGPEAQPVAEPEKAIATPPGYQGQQRFLEIELAQGDITQTRTQLIVIGTFQNTPPLDAVRSLDLAMGGALSELSKRRPPSLVRGELDVVPTSGFPIWADGIAFLGLGPLSNFSSDGNSLASATEDGLRALLLCRVEEFSTILLGVNAPEISGNRVEFALKHMMAGFCKALREEKEGENFRRIILVERSQSRFSEIEGALRKLIAGGGIFEGIDVRYRKVILPAPESLPLLSRANRINLEPDEQHQSGQLPRTRFTFFQANPGAGVPRFISEAMTSEAVQEIYRLGRLVSDNSTYGGTPVLGAGIAGMEDLDRISQIVTSFVPAEIRRQLSEKENASSRVELTHEKSTAIVPWECLNLGPPGTREVGHYPALCVGMSRSFTFTPTARVQNIARRESGPLRVLIVVNPTGDLEGAEQEGLSLRSLLTALGPEKVEVIYLSSAEATRERLFKVLNELPIDILHYAGHSFYSQKSPGSSGLLLYQKKVFSGDDVTNLKKVPSIVVFNSCEAAKIHFADNSVKRGLRTQEERSELAAQGAVTMAEAILISGVKHFVGTFWPVSDEAAAHFSNELYRNLADYKTMGASICAARKALFTKNSPDWANYIHYGDPGAHPFSNVER